MVNIKILEHSDDISDLVPLSREFFSEYQHHHKDFFNISSLQDQDVIDYFHSFCGQETRRAYIAIAGDHLVGYITAYVKDQASYWRFRKIGEISGLMVRKDFRGQGIAKLLLAHAKVFFAEHSVRYFTVYTAVANRIGLDFYHKNGLAPLYTTLLGEVE